MKRFVLALGLAAVLLTGCNSKHSELEPQVESVSLFSEGKGIWFSDETRKLLGVEIAEVTEKPIGRRIQKTGQVYRPAGNGSPAAAMLRLEPGEARELTIGESAAIKGAGESAEIIAKLIRLDRQAEAMLGQVEALLEFADPQRQFTVGSFLTATFADVHPRSALVVPESAVLAAADGYYVYAVNGTRLTKTAVKLGAVSGGMVEVKDGLYPGDSVAVKGVENLWLVELSALKGGTPCCAVPKRDGEK